MSPREIRLYQSRIDDIVQSSKRLAIYAKNIKKVSDLETADPMLLDAIIRRLQIIGEAAHKIITEHEASHQTTKVDWDAVSRFRHLVVHDYWKIDAEDLWDAVKNFVPHLVRHLKK
jgi:uncharacterized protein with HEPN domain